MPIQNRITIDSRPDTLVRNWYAMRIIADRTYVKAFVEMAGIQSYSTSLMPTLLFVRCTDKELETLYGERAGKFFFYYNTGRTRPGRIDEREMRSFMLVTSADPDSLIQLDAGADESFFTGQKVRVTAGPFEGAEGIVKRIKGDRRLIVQVSGIAVVATAFIHPSLLDPVE